MVFDKQSNLCLKLWSWSETVIRILNVASGFSALQLGPVFGYNGSSRPESAKKHFRRWCASLISVRPTSLVSAPSPELTGTWHLSASLCSPTPLPHPSPASPLLVTLVDSWLLLHQAWPASLLDVLTLSVLSPSLLHSKLWLMAFQLASRLSLPLASRGVW